MKRRTFFSMMIIAACWLSGYVMAAEAPDALVKRTTDEVLSRVKSQKDALRKDYPRLHALVDELVVPHFDFQRMSRWVLGRHWKTASTEQRTAFVHEFKTLLVRSYASALLEFSDHQIHYRPMHAAEGAKEVTVKTEVQQEGQQFVPMIYRMNQKPSGKWKVFDVTVDGISLLATYRSEFAAQVKQYGIDGLIKNIAAKNAGTQAEVAKRQQ